MQTSEWKVLPRMTLWKMTQHNDGHTSWHAPSFRDVCLRKKMTKIEEKIKRSVSFYVKVSELSK